MTEKIELHIWNGLQANRNMSYCGKEIDRGKPHFISPTHAMHAMIQNLPAKPCPDCAREIIKQLLKAIE